MADLSGVMNIIDALKTPSNKIDKHFDIDDFYDKDSKIKYSHRLQEWIGQLSAQTLYGINPTFTVEKAKLKVDQNLQEEILKILDDNFFTETITTLEREALSISGAGALGIILDSDAPKIVPIGQIIKAVYDPFGKLLSFSAQFSRLAGTFSFIEVIEWNPNSYTRMYKENPEGTPIKLPVLLARAGENAIYIPHLKDRVVHNLGMVLVQMIFNKPHQPALLTNHKLVDSGVDYERLSDIYYGKHYLPAIDFIYTKLLKETQRSATKILIQRPLGVKNQTDAEKKARDFDKQEVIAEIDSTQDDKFQYVGGIYQSLAALQGQIDALEVKFLKSCFAQSGTLKAGKFQSNDMEAFQDSRPMVQYFEAKRSYRQKLYNEFLAMFFKVYTQYYFKSNWKSIKITINIMPNEIRDRAKIIEAIVAQLEAGIITRIDAIAQSNNVSVTDAEVMLNQIKEDAKFNQEQNAHKPKTKGVDDEN